jgi:hypothetical protein
MRSLGIAQDLQLTPCNPSLRPDINWLFNSSPCEIRHSSSYTSCPDEPIITRCDFIAVGCVVSVVDGAEIFNNH